MPHPGGPVDGVGNGRRRRVDDDFANGLRTKRAGRLVALLKFHLQTAHIQPGGQAVLQKAALHRLAVGIVGDVFHQRHADTLHDAALGLGAGQRRVDGLAAVHHRLVVQHPHLAGEGVHLHLRHAHHEGRRRYRGGMAHGGLQRGLAAALGGVGQIRQRQPPAVRRTHHAAGGKFHLAFRHAQLLGGQRTQLLFQLGAGQLHRLAGDVGGGGGVGTGIVGRSIGVRAKHGHILHRAVHTFGGHLGQDGVAAGAHVRRADEQMVPAILIQLDGGGANVHVGNAGALHRHGNAGGAHLAVPHVPHGVAVLPVKDLLAAGHAAVQCAGVVGLAVVGGHPHALPHHVLLPDGGGIHAKGLGQLVDGALHRKNALCGAVAPVGPGGLQVGVHHIKAEPERLQPAGVQRDGLVARQAHRGGAVLAVSAGVGQGEHIQRPDVAVPVCAQPQMHLHLMPGGACDLALLPGVNELGGAAGHEGDKGGVHLADGGLLGAKTAANTRFFHPDAAFGDAQCAGQDAPRMEHDLGAGQHPQATVAVQRGVGAEGLHHGLIAGGGVVGAIQHDVAVRQHRVHIAVAAHLAGHQIAPVVAAHVAGREPVLLGMHQHRVVLGGVGVQHGGQDFVRYFDEFHRPRGGCAGLGGDDGHRVARKAQMPV